MRVIGVTGGVGAGKSTVLGILEEDFQAYVIQADQLGHILMEPGEECYDAVIALFGNLKLNGIIHPAVKQRILDLLGEQKDAGRGICVVEAALFLEENYQEFCDEVWYVYTEEEIRIRRLMESRGYSREKSLGIIRNQVSDQVFREHTDYVIGNNGDLKETRRQIREGIERNETL